MMQFPTKGLAAGCVALVLLSGCASAVRTETARFTPLTAEQPASVMRLASDATVTPATGYPRTLKSGSQWRLAGNVTQGQVFRPINSVFTIEGRQVHEAYLVVSGGQLVGFYLPGEANYAALNVPVPLSIGDSQ